MKKAYLYLGSLLSVLGAGLLSLEFYGMEFIFWARLELERNYPNYFSVSFPESVSSLIHPHIVFAYAIDVILIVIGVVLLVRAFRNCPR